MLLLGVGSTENRFLSQQIARAEFAVMGAAV